MAVTIFKMISRVLFALFVEVLGYSKPLSTAAITCDLFSLSRQ